MTKWLMQFVALAMVTSGVSQQIFCRITENSTTQEVCTEIFENLYEFNYSLQPPRPGTPYKQTQFLMELPICGTPIITPKVFYALTTKTIRLMSNMLLHSNARWIDTPPDPSLIDNENDFILIQALIVNPNTVIASMGDYHGNAHSFARNETRFSYEGLAESNGHFHENVLVIDKGDLGDRGHYSVETWSLAMACKNQNPEQFIILQGNHENPGTQEDPGLYAFLGSKAEFDAKFHKFPQALTSLLNLFWFFPQICFIGAPACNGEIVFIQFCHAGIEHPEHPSVMHIKQFLEQVVAAHPPLGTPCYHVLQGLTQNNGFTWNSFSANADPQAEGVIKRSCYSIFHGRIALDYLYTISHPGHYRVCAIDRGHDHLDLGINQLKYNLQASTFKEQCWTPVEHLNTVPMDFHSEPEGFPVFTGTSAPEGYGCDAYALIRFDAEHGQWLLTSQVYGTPHSNEPVDEHGNWQQFRWKTTPLPDEHDFELTDDRQRTRCKG